MKWINAFLCYRQQRVVVNGVKSDWAPVVSGVPQGTVLGPLLFSLHINDITTDIESTIRLFTDDCVCYREIKDKEETNAKSLRSSKQETLKVPFARATYYEKSFSVTGPKLWNSLPIQIRQSSNLITFKQSVKSFYLSEQLNDP